MELQLQDSHLSTNGSFFTWNLRIVNKSNAIEFETAIVFNMSSNVAIIDAPMYLFNAREQLSITQSII